MRGGSWSNKFGLRDLKRFLLPYPNYDSALNASTMQEIEKMNTNEFDKLQISCCCLIALHSQNALLASHKVTKLSTIFKRNIVVLLKSYNIINNFQSSKAY